MSWPAGTTGTLELPSGVRIRGRRLTSSADRSPAEPEPDYAVHLVGRLDGRRSAPLSWPVDSIRWPDFWLPEDQDGTIEMLRAARRRAEVERVEISCPGGVGRTGTALAVLCVLDGLEPAAAVRWVRVRYHPRAVEVPWQRLLLRRAVS